MPEYVTKTITAADGSLRFLADRDTLSRTTGYSAVTIRLRCQPTEYDPDTDRALYDQEAIVAQLEAAGVKPRPHLQGVSRAKRSGPSKRRRKRGP